MISFDTNIALPALEATNILHGKSLAFMRSLEVRDDVLVSEFTLVELYGLLRNPMVVAYPMSSSQAVEVCQHFRAHPRWSIAGFGNQGRALHDNLWKKAGEKSFPRRRIYDLRMALSLVQHGVTEFATVNLKDFEDAGFQHVWNPLSE